MIASKSQQVSPQDELKLRWYFGGRGNIFESSNAPSQFEAVHASNVASFECPVCDGDGMLFCGGPRAKRCSRCNGIGRIERNIKGAMVPRSGYVRCQACHGAVGLNRLCEFCGGDGYAVENVAFCAHESEAIVFIAGDAQLFQRQGEMVRAMAKLNDAMKAIGERYYGPEGDRWARTRRGRIFSLYDFTDSGGRLIRRSPKAYKRLTGLEKIGMLADADKRIPEHDRTILLANAYVEAKELFVEFSVAWVTAMGGSDGQA